jgi:hypothetical protein
MESTIRLSPAKAAEIMEAVIARGDLAQLTAEERGKYYVRVCDSVGLNPMTRPLEYLVLNGKMVLYARKDATDQLRSLYKVSVAEITEREHEGVWIVSAKVADADGRTDCAIGAVDIKGLSGMALANALMKAETKAKRRATLSLCGLGFLDETEVEDIPAKADAPIANLPAVRQARATKSASKAVRDRMQGEIAAETTSEGLSEWREVNAARLELLPLDWQMNLSLLFEEQMTDLLAREQDGVIPDIPAIDRWHQQQADQWAGRAVGNSVASRPDATIVVTAEVKNDANGATVNLDSAKATIVSLGEAAKNALSKSPPPLDGIPAFLRRDTPTAQAPWLGLVQGAWGTD